MTSPTCTRSWSPPTATSSPASPFRSLVASSEAWADAAEPGLHRPQLPGFGAVRGGPGEDPRVRHCDRRRQPGVRRCRRGPGAGPPGRDRSADFPDRVDLPVLCRELDRRPGPRAGVQPGGARRAAVRPPSAGAGRGPAGGDVAGGRHPRCRTQRTADHPIRGDHRRQRAGRHRLQHAGQSRHRRQRSTAGGVMAAAVRYADVEVGTEVPAVDFAVQRVNLVRYCGASGDFNTIHWNERFATSVGLPNVIAHGMYTMAEAARVVTDWVGDPGAVVEYGVRFSSPVVVPDDGVGATLTVSGRVEEKLADNRVVVGHHHRTGEADAVLHDGAGVADPVGDHPRRLGHRVHPVGDDVGQTDRGGEPLVPVDGVEVAAGAAVADQVDPLYREVDRGDLGADFYVGVPDSRGHHASCCAALAAVPRLTSVLYTVATRSLSTVVTSDWVVSSSLRPASRMSATRDVTASRSPARTGRWWTNRCSPCTTRLYSSPRPGSTIELSSENRKVNTVRNVGGAITSGWPSARASGWSTAGWCTASSGSSTIGRCGPGTGWR